MKIYIDSDYRCHTADDGTCRAVETAAFDGKCAAFIEGYRYIPAGASWTRSDGVSFNGEAISPWKEYRILEAYQEQYEAMLPEMQDMKAALTELEVIPDE